MSLQIVWVKRDLRVHDHAPLAEPAADGRQSGFHFGEPDA